MWDLKLIEWCVSRWEPDLVNMVDGEAIQSAIRAILTLLRSTCDTVHCLGERALFSSSFGIIFSQFLLSNAPITPYNIPYWWFSLSQGNLWIKYCTHSKIWRPKSYQLTFAFLVALGGFHPLLFFQLTADLTLECINGSLFYPLSYTAWKNPFYCAETAPSSALNRRHIVVFDQRSAKTILWTFFIFWNDCRIRAPRAFSIIGVCTAVFKISKPLPYHLSLWSIVLTCQAIAKKSIVTRTTVLVTYELNVWSSWNFNI